MGHIYCLDCGDFVKVGKSEKPNERIKSLRSKYKTPDGDSWVSEDFQSFDDAENIAHEILKKFRIRGHKTTEIFTADLQSCISASMEAIHRSEGQEIVGNVCGMDVLCDVVNGYINSTKFFRGFGIYQFLKTEGMKNLSEQIREGSAQPTHFTTRGKNSSTFVHPLVFIELNRAAGVKSKVAVYRWMLHDMPHVESIRKCLKTCFAGIKNPIPPMKIVEV